MSGGTSEGARRVSAPELAAAGRVALVTGGARGIGAAIADGLLAIGAQVAILDLDGAALERLPARRAQDRRPTSPIRRPARPPSAGARGPMAGSTSWSTTPGSAWG